MCFKGDASGPDIWLTIENGRYVPAPPMVYMPGLRQIQDRIHHRVYHPKSPLDCINDSVQVPLASPLPTSVSRSAICTPAPPALDTPVIGPPQPPVEISNPEPAPPTVTDHDTNVAPPTTDSESVETPISPKATNGEPSQGSTGPSPEARREEQPEDAAQADEDSSDSMSIADSSMSNDTSPSPGPSSSSSSSSSSLRSILKKPPTSTSENTESEDGDKAVAKDNRKDETDQKEDGRQKMKKSVSFARDTAPPVTPLPAALPRSTTAPQLTAAKEGAAIARKLVERQSAQNRGKGFHHLGGGDRSADLGRNARQPKPGSSTAHSGQRVGKYQRGTPGGGNKAPRNTRGVIDGPGVERTRAAVLTQSLLSSDENDSYIDDEMLRKWL